MNAQNRSRVFSVHRLMAVAAALACIWFLSSSSAVKSKISEVSSSTTSKLSSTLSDQGSKLSKAFLLEHHKHKPKLISDDDRDFSFVNLPVEQTNQELLENRPWMNYALLEGYYNGIKALTTWATFVRQYPDVNHGQKFMEQNNITSKFDLVPEFELPIKAEPSDPYPEYHTFKYKNQFHPVTDCFLDSNKSVAPPNVYHYKGVPQLQPDPPLGSYSVLGMEEGVCFDRFGRLGPYGYGYSEAAGGTGVGIDTEDKDAELVWEEGQINWTEMNAGAGVNWGEAQKQCFMDNKDRFRTTHSKTTYFSKTGRKPISRTAVVLRAFPEHKWTPYFITHLRAMITELNIKSGGEYDVHLLMQQKEGLRPIPGSREEKEVIDNIGVPAEFRDIVTLWTFDQMESIYTTPFGEAFQNPSGRPIMGVYRSLHMPMQWFAVEHPEYDHFMQWEMDLRYTGHYYEFFNSIDKWSTKTSRHLLWERSAKYYIPELHGDYEAFTQLVKEQTKDAAPVGAPRAYNNLHWPGQEIGFDGRQWLNETGIPPPPGCDDYRDQSACGVGEEADVITFNPIFNPHGTYWMFDLDMSGYDHGKAHPPRRTALVAASRYSRRLLVTMHEEMMQFGHSAFPEMFPATIALHHGFKAVQVPHPIYYDRAWPLQELEAKLNGAAHGGTGGNWNSPYAWSNEHNLAGSSYYYNAEFAGRLWRRWLGYKDGAEDPIGGREMEKKTTGRMCLRGMLLHPIKKDRME